MIHTEKQDTVVEKTAVELTSQLDITAT